MLKQTCLLIILFSFVVSLAANKPSNHNLKTESQTSSEFYNKSLSAIFSPNFIADYENGLNISGIFNTVSQNNLQTNENTPQNKEMKRPLIFLDPIWSFALNLGATYSGDLDNKMWNGKGRKQAYIGALAGVSDGFRRGTSFKCYTLEAGTFIGRYGSDKVQFVPAIGASYTKSFLYLRSMFTPNFMLPTVGLNLMNTMQIQAGYYIPFREKNGVKIKGFSIGLSITVGYKHFYSYKDR